MQVTLGELIESGRKAINEGVIGSLLIVAKDVGGTSLKQMGGFAARFDDKKQVDKFMSTARMEYPGIDKKIRSKKLSDGRIELALSPADARKFESY